MRRCPFLPVSRPNPTVRSPCGRTAMKRRPAGDGRADAQISLPLCFTATLHRAFGAYGRTATKRRSAGDGRARCADALSPCFTAKPHRALGACGVRAAKRRRGRGGRADVQRCPTPYSLPHAPPFPHPLPSRHCRQSGHLPTRADAQSSSLSPRGRPAASNRHQALFSKTAFRRSPHEQEQRIHPRHHSRRAHHHH